MYNTLFFSIIAKIEKRKCTAIEKSVYMTFMNIFYLTTIQIPIKPSKNCNYLKTTNSLKREKRHQTNKKRKHK